MTKKYLCTLFLVLIFSSAGWAGPSISKEEFFAFSQFPVAEKFYRTELYFGMNKPGGIHITEEEWNTFLTNEVTPRFPDGFTVLDGYGQWKNKEGKVVKEDSKVFIVLYKKADLKTATAKLDEIRVAYIKTFQQQSVLRMDIVQTVRVSF
jgi:hypothetical protein